MRPTLAARPVVVGLAALFIAAQLIASSASPVEAAFQASVYSNITAFQGSCDGTNDTISSQLYTLARAGFTYLTYTPVAYEQSTFTRAQFLSRVGGDKATYVHSHGDYYNPSGDQGFREDAGKCTGGLVVNSADVDAKVSTPAQLVIMSTCVLGEVPGNGTLSMAAAFGIPQNQSATADIFYMGYKSHAYTSDMLAFEQKFWSYVESGGPNNTNYYLAQAFSLARAQVHFSTPPGYATVSAAWYGSPTYTGWADTRLGCTHCN